MLSHYNTCRIAYYSRYGYFTVVHGEHIKSDTRDDCLTVSVNLDKSCRCRYLRINKGKLNRFGFFVTPVNGKCKYKPAYRIAYARRNAHLFKMIITVRKPSDHIRFYNARFICLIISNLFSRTVIYKRELHSCKGFGLFTVKYLLKGNISVTLSVINRCVLRLHDVRLCIGVVGINCKDRTPDDIGIAYFFISFRCFGFFKIVRTPCHVSDGYPAVSRCRKYSGGCSVLCRNIRIYSILCPVQLKLSALKSGFRLIIKLDQGKRTRLLLIDNGSEFYRSLR